MQIRSTAILSPCSPNPFTTFLPIEEGRELGHRLLRSNRLDRISKALPLRSLRSFRCPTLGGRGGRPHVSEGTAVSGVALARYLATMCRA